MSYFSTHFHACTNLHTFLTTPPLKTQHPEGHLDRWNCGFLRARARACLCAATPTLPDTFLGMTKTRSKLSGKKTARALRDQINHNRVVKDKKATMTEVYRGGGLWDAVSILVVILM